MSNWASYLVRVVIDEGSSTQDSCQPQMMIVLRDKLEPRFVDLSLGYERCVAVVVL
jgi:hypothetical protein